MTFAVSFECNNDDSKMDTWQTKKFGEIAELSKKKYNPLISSKKVACIELKHISKETGRLLGHVCSTHKKSTKNIFVPGSILFGRLRPYLKKYLYCDFSGICSSEIWVITPKEGIHDRFLYYLVQHDKFISSACVASGSKMPRADWGYISRVLFSIPPLPDQEAIACVLHTWDSSVHKTESLIAAKEKQFVWLLKKIINRCSIKKTQLSNFISEITVRNTDNNIQQVLSITNKSGFAISEDQFERRIASADTSNYKIVKKGEYAYNPSRINVGSIARLNCMHSGILSPMYTVFKLNENRIDSDYFLHWLSSFEAKQRIKMSAQGSVRETVGFDDLGAIPIPLPDIATQKKISQTLNVARREIDLLKVLAKLYHEQQRGVMLRLLNENRK